MNLLDAFFWVVVIIWIILSLAKKQVRISQGDPPAEEEGYRKPEEAMARFLRSLAGEEEIKVTPPFEPIVEEALPPPEPQPRMEETASPKLEEPIYEKVELPERREEACSPILGTLDISTARQGIILSEILGPPRAERPL